MIKYFLIVFSLLAIAFTFAPSTPVFAQIDPANKAKACEALPSGGCSGGDAAVTSLWTTIINLVAFIVGLVSVLMVVIGGLRYVLSNGDAQGTAAAKNTILYAVVGLIVAISARAIVLFVLEKI